MSRKWFTDEADGRFEHREAKVSEMECPSCGATVPLLAETDQWVEKSPRVWRHDGYGCPMAQCCGLLLVDNFGRGEAYNLEAVR